MIEEDLDTMAGKVSDIVRRFLKSKFDQDPSRIMVLVEGDMIIVRTKGIFSKAERELARTKEDRELINKMYYALFENAHPLLQRMLKTFLGLEVVNIQTEINFKNSELIQLMNISNLDTYDSRI